IQTELTKAMDDRQTSVKAFDEAEQAQSTEQSESISDFAGHVRGGLEALAADISDSSPQDYVPTGDTPQKRGWQYPRELPQTAAHESIVARRRCLPDPTIEAKTPSTARTPGRSPKKHTSPRKASPSKATSPAKARIYTDKMMESQAHTVNLTEPLKGLKEVDINVVAPPRHDAHAISFSKSMGSGPQPPLK
ncbi:MAG: kinesin motor protein cin8, partial [Watsoniomyces obsoletus]